MRRSSEPQRLNSHHESFIKSNYFPKQINQTEDLHLSTRKESGLPDSRVCLKNAWGVQNGAMIFQTHSSADALSLQ